jgi:chemotaxis protein methyltransferase CheR
MMVTLKPTVSAADFSYVCQLVRQDSSIALDDGKAYLVEARLGALARDQGFASVSELVRHVRAGADGLRRQVLEAMITSETLFFRDVHPFDALRQEILPSALRRRGDNQVSIWSAASASGQEPYSVALLLRTHFPNVRPTILATDLSNSNLLQAKSGRFSQLEVNRGLPANLLVKFFHRDGRHWQLDDEVRRMVTFRQLNLAESLPALPPMDVILLRNVLIYFDLDVRHRVLHQVARVLRPGGYLLLGGTETLVGLGTPFERVLLGRSVCYRLPPPKEGIR